MARSTTIPRILFFNRFLYFDSTNGAAVASRALMEGLNRHGHATEVVSGTVVDAGPEAEPMEFLANFGIPREELATGTRIVGASISHDVPTLRVNPGGVPVTLLDRRLRTNSKPEAAEGEAMLRLADEAFDRFRPDVLISYGGDSITGEVFLHARRRGIATVFTLHDFHYRDSAPFANVDAVVVPSRFAASYYREALNLRCTTLPNFVDFERVRAKRRSSGYVTFVNPSIEKGVYVFARIADELGKRRPDIPLLVVEARGNGPSRSTSPRGWPTCCSGRKRRDFIRCSSRRRASCG